VRLAGDEGLARGAATARQTAWSLQSLFAPLVAKGGSSREEIRKSIEALVDATAKPESFDATAFAAKLASLRGSFESLGK
jgi:hypothetical protein